MCSRIGTITGKNSHNFGRMTERETEDPARSKKNQTKQDKRERVCASKRELIAPPTR